MITDINLLLIAQMINFIIAYFIIRVLLLKPAINVILQDQAERTKSQVMINCTIKENEAKKDTIVRRWMYCQQECLQLAPPSTYMQEALDIKEIKKPLSITEVSPAHKKAVSQDITDALIQRMSHVR